jgi:hypothetical protein
MKNKLITFEVEEINLPDNRPYIKRVYPSGAPYSLSLDDPRLTYADMVNVEEKIFERIELRDPANPSKNAFYFINFEDANEAMPILKGLVDSQVRTIRKENIDLRVQVAMLSDQVKYYRSFWFNRLWRWIKGKI